MRRRRNRGWEATALGLRWSVPARLPRLSPRAARSLGCDVLPGVRSRPPRRAQSSSPGCAVVLPGVRSRPPRGAQSSSPGCDITTRDQPRPPARADRRPNQATSQTAHARRRVHGPCEATTDPARTLSRHPRAAWAGVRRAPPRPHRSRVTMLRLGYSSVTLLQLGRARGDHLSTCGASRTCSPGSARTRRTEPALLDRTRNAHVGHSRVKSYLRFGRSFRNEMWSWPIIPTPMTSTFTATRVVPSSGRSVSRASAGRATAGWPQTAPLPGPR